MTKQQKDYCISVYGAALFVYQSDHDGSVSPRFTTAQAMLESGWGKASIGNNIFGITKGSGWQGKTRLVTTREYFSTPDRQFHQPEQVISVRKLKAGCYLYQCKRLFRDYDSIQEAVIDHNRIFQKPIYSDAWPYRFYAKDFARRISDGKLGKYATDPNYTRTLIRMIDIVNNIIKEAGV